MSSVGVVGHLLPASVSESLDIVLVVLDEAHGVGFKCPLHLLRIHLLVDDVTIDGGRGL